jgi:hypothetical protein
LAVIGGLIWLAVLGYVLAYLVLAILGTVGLIGLGLSFGLIHTRITAERQQQAFLDNAQENLSLMNALQSLQNKQNQTLLQQLGHLSRLPHPTQTDPFLIEEGVFDKLDD